LTRAHKIIIFVIALITLLGLGWDKVKLADARYSKSIECKVAHHEINTDITLLGQTIQNESMDRLIESKRGQVRYWNGRLRQNISESEKFEIQQDIKVYEQEISDLQKKQENLFK